MSTPDSQVSFFRVRGVNYWPALSFGIVNKYKFELLAAKLELVCCSDNRDPSECVELTDRESFVCEAICYSEDAVSFSDLKRATHVHQEILSRILRRLVVHGVVKKLEDGRYRKALH